MISDNEQDKSQNNRSNPYHTAKATEKGISDAKIESSEESENQFDRESGNTNSPSRTTIFEDEKLEGQDLRTNDIKVGSSKTSLSPEEIRDIDKEIEGIEGGGDTGKGRATGSDKG